MDTKYSSLLFVITAALLWGIGDFFSKMAVTALGPWKSAFLRSLFFLPIVIIYVLYKKDFEFSLDSDSIYPILAGGFVGVGIIFSRLSLSTYEVSLVKPIQRLSILITVILSVLFLKEKITKLKTIGVVLAVSAFFLLYPINSELLNLELGHLYLIFLILSLGLSTVFLRVGILKKGVNYTRFFRALLQTALIFSSVIILFGFSGISIPITSDIIYPALNGILGGIAFILFCRGLTSIGASTAKPVMVLATITTVSLGILVLNEELFFSKILGIGLALVAVVLLSYEEV